MKRLLRSIWHLGIRLGWRYWKIENQCIERPEMVLDWAHACRLEAVDAIGKDGDPFADDAYWKILMNWADELENSYLDYVQPRTETAHCRRD